MKRANVTVSRNDVRPEGFKRWTVYADGKAVFDIEATGLDGGKALVHVLDAGDGHRTFAAYDGRSDSFFTAPEKPQAPRSDLPQCVQAMGCYCAGHARGNAADSPCDTSEVDDENPPDGWEECGGCGSWHPADFGGDCRDDAHRWPFAAHA